MSGRLSGSSTLPTRRSLEGSKGILVPSTVLHSTLMARGKGREPLKAPVETITNLLFVTRLCSYSSGGEDGYVRIHYFDPQYFDFELEA